MHPEFGFVRVTTAVPRVTVGDPAGNTAEILRVLRQLPDSDIVVFPELCISAYSCGDLFHQKALLDETAQQLEWLASETRDSDQLIFVGAPVRKGNALYNCAVGIHRGKVRGVSPKQFVPNYKEFYEARWFASGQDDESGDVLVWSENVPFGTRLMYTTQATGSASEVLVYPEICEAVWMPIPPSSMAVIAGANLICNLSASNETVGKADYRRGLVTAQSGRCIAGYAYTSSGPTESTNDVVFGGHALIAEAGHLLCESTRVGDVDITQRESYWVTADIDVERIQTERRTTTSFADAERYLQGISYTRIPVTFSSRHEGLHRHVAAHPFVPSDESQLHQRCSEVFGIQTAALAKRLECLGSNPTLSIGISGGLDSTLALLVAIRTCDMLSLPRSCIRAVTMPGFGTTDHTLTNARKLMEYLGVKSIELDIREAVLLEFKELHQAVGYRPFGMIDPDSTMTLDEFVKAVMAVPGDKQQDLVFENVQARRRTELLMNMGFVLGTGDMSELWLGWCTYNADHQSMYNVNCSVPKTLVRFLVEYVAQHDFESPVTETLMSIAATEISPELLPPSAEGEIAQSTEDTVGPYELHDFFMFHLLRYGYTPAKVSYLAGFAKGWFKDYTDQQIRHWLGVNLKRAFAQQYKRDDVPNGPKVGSISLSPRGDWRMPSDATAAAWIRNLGD